MRQYRYVPLSRESYAIRVLQLLPSKSGSDFLTCKLHEYPLENADTTNHVYEALSYVWGGEEKPKSIMISTDDPNEGSQRPHSELAITQSLHTALSRLQHPQFPRFLWVDAVCINQMNDQEKEHQIQLMPAIYARARCVLVWLGEAQDDSDMVLESIRRAGERSGEQEETETFWLRASERGIEWGTTVNRLRQATRVLLNRPWFRQIAAARQVTILCGSTEIDGHALSLGLGFMSQNLEIPLSPVTVLMRRAIFRPRQLSKMQARFSLNIGSLSELIDQYQANEASRHHDKVYALLGMSSDDVSAAGLEPDYKLRWDVLMQRFLRCLVGSQVFTHTAEDKEIAIIRGKCWVLGRVFSVTTTQDSKIKVDFFRKYNFDTLEDDKGCHGTWFLPPSAKPIKQGDVLCLLQGAPKPTIIRSCETHFAVVYIGAVPQGQSSMELSPSRPLAKSLSRDLLLIWNWEKPAEESQDSYAYDLIQAPKSTGLLSRINYLTDVWNTALILGDLGAHRRAQELLEEAVKGYKIAFGKREPHMAPASQICMTPLAFAATNGYTELADLLLAGDGIDPDSEDSNGQRPLSHAAQHGHITVVQRLLALNQVKIDAIDKRGQTALLLASINGHEDVIKQLLKRDFANADLKDVRNGRTPLLWAAANGHTAVVKLFLGTGLVDVNSKDSDYGRTPLSWAAGNGHTAVVKLFLGTGLVDVNSEDAEYGRTPLSWAAGNGHTAVVKLLLKTNLVDIDTKDRQQGRTPLSWASGNGHEAVARLLLEAGPVAASTHIKDSHGRTALFWGAGAGHEAIVKLLLETSQTGIDLKDSAGWTPLLWAASKGQESIVKVLLQTGRVDVNAKDTENSRTSLSWAAEQGNEALVSLLLAVSHVNVEAKDTFGRTPLFQAVLGGHEAVAKSLIVKGKANPEVKDMYGRTPLLSAANSFDGAIVKLLLETGRVDIEAKDQEQRTPLIYAAQTGSESVVKLLLETGRVDIEAKDNNQRTPLICAAQTGSESVVKLLLETGRVDIEAKDYDQRTPLICAAQRRSSESVVKLLLETGRVDIEAKDYERQTPLICAAREGSDSVVKLPIEMGQADVNAKDWCGGMPLAHAVAYGREAVVKTLIEVGHVDVNARDRLGRTLLSCAIDEGHEAVAKVLLDNGAHAGPRDRWLDTAARNKRQEMPWKGRFGMGSFRSRERMWRCDEERMWRYDEERM